MLLLSRAGLECVQNRAVPYWAGSAACLGQAVKSIPHSLQIGNLGFDAHELCLGSLAHHRSRGSRSQAQLEQLTNLFEREPEFLRTLDKAHLPHGFRVEPTVTLR